MSIEIAPIDLSKIVVKGKTGAAKVYAYVDGKRVLASDAKKNWLNLDQKTQQMVTQYAVSMGHKPNYAKTIWGQLIDASSAELKSGVQKTPLQILQEQNKLDETPYVSTTKEQYNPDAQMAAINSAYIKLVGRVANQDEISQIISDANKQAGTKNTVVYSDKGPTTTVTPDLTPEQIATNKLMSAPEYATERKGVQDLGFLSWINNAISGGVSAAGGQANG